MSRWEDLEATVAPISGESLELLWRTLITADQHFQASFEESSANLLARTRSPVTTSVFSPGILPGNSTAITTPCNNFKDNVDKKSSRLLQVTVAANKRLVKVLDMLQVPLPRNKMPITMTCRIFRQELRILGVPQEKADLAVLEYKKKKHSLQTLLWRERKKMKGKAAAKK